MDQVSPDTLFEKLRHIQPDNPLCRYTKERCAYLAPLINRILKLKKEKNAIILAHTYVHPDIIYGVADHVGDSLGLAQVAKDTEADIIVFPAVRFMAETAKILNPSKIVIDPNPNGGCTLADSITDQDVALLREQYPDHTFVCYVNTTAHIKALCDVCVTSANAYTVVKNIPNDKIYFLPDYLMGQNLQAELDKNNVPKKLMLYHGSCYVHEQFDEEMLLSMKKIHPDLQVMAHPECKPEVARHADVVCSTTKMIDYVKERSHVKSPFLLLTECGVASRLQVECSDLKLVGACVMCRYMRSNSLEQLLQALENPKDSQVITLEEDIIERAKCSLDAMFFYTHNSVLPQKESSLLI